VAEAKASKPGQTRFFDSRAAYMMFVTTTNEKAAVADRVGRELEHVSLGPRALRVFDAGMGDGSVLARLMRRMHQAHPHIPWLVVAKEISIEDVRQALARLPDRFYEHPELVFVVTNMYYGEAPALEPRGNQPSPSWRVAPLEGSTAHDFERQIQALYPQLAQDWHVRTSAKTGNPLYDTPSALILYRRDHEFILDGVIPRQGSVTGEYDLIVASQTYRARTPASRKVATVIGPLARALAPGGRLVVVQARGDDPGLEIVHGVWPGENPFQTDRHELIDVARATLDSSGDTDLAYDAGNDEESIFQYELHAMPSEAEEHIGTSSILAAWNAAVYVAQIDETRLSEAMAAGKYIEPTRDVMERHGGVWFNNESFVISRVPENLSRTQL
jgi:hypothetical protein